VLRYNQVNNRVRRVVIEPAITRAFFSQRRAWHGDRVVLHVETRDVPDGAALCACIVEVGTNVTLEGDLRVELPGAHTVANNRCRIEHTLRWDPGTLGRPWQLRGERREFCARVAIARFKLQRDSAPLYVDLHPFVLSG
jgi:hypothetical protein